jgi:uncharacterized protein (TIGR03435 family)
MAELTAILRLELDRPVIDKTGLTGAHEFRLLYAARNAVSDDPSIFTALEEQLGLKLEAGRGSVDILVIDSVGRPTEN